MDCTTVALIGAWTPTFAMLGFALALWLHERRIERDVRRSDEALQAQWRERDRQSQLQHYGTTDPDRIAEIDAEHKSLMRAYDLWRTYCSAPSRNDPKGERFGEFWPVESELIEADRAARRKADAERLEADRRTAAAMRAARLGSGEPRNDH